MTAISARTPEVWISYNTSSGRKVKHFADARKGRSFFSLKFKSGNHPSVHKEQPTMSETTTATEAAAVEAEAPAPDATKPAKKRTAARKAPAAAKKKKAATKKKKAPAKKKAPVKKKKTDATQPASAGRGRPISSDKVHRMFLVLSRLCKEPGHSDGLTRPELRKDCGFEDLGTPQLQDKGYVTLSKHEGHRGVVVKATKEGRAIAKSEEKFAQSFTH